jgi:hypothetical protein
LNVIHHLKEPINVLRNLSLITKEKLIVEFPTFSDPKFRKKAQIYFPWLFNRLPIIGVSSLSDKRTNQTFIFTPSAIKKVLLDHDKLFETIDIFRSPFKGRQIAICRK